MATKLIGKKASLLTDACDLDKEIKDKKKELDNLKDQLDLGKGKYFNALGRKVTISETPKLSDPSPMRVHNLLKKMKLSSKFYSIIKVQVTDFKKLVGVPAVDKLREDSGEVSTKYLFK